jgi:hypothetical protein
MTPGSGRDLQSSEIRPGPEDDAQPTRIRSPYEPPRVSVYGRLTDLTSKNGGPGNDNPGRQRSLP